jgi:hypothetical protein
MRTPFEIVLDTEADAASSALRVCPERSGGIAEFSEHEAD